VSDLERDLIMEVISEHAIDFQGVPPDYDGDAVAYIADRILALLSAPEPAETGEVTPERRALALDALYQSASGGVRDLLDEVGSLRLPAHQCETVADFDRYMNELGQEHAGARIWRIGRLTEPIEGFPEERWCFHIRTPLNPEIVFGFNEADLNYMVATAYAALGYHTNPAWVEAIAASASTHTPPAPTAAPEPAERSALDWEPVCTECATEAGVPIRCSTPGCENPARWWDQSFASRSPAPTAAEPEAVWAELHDWKRFDANKAEARSASIQVWTFPQSETATVRLLDAAEPESEALAAIARIIESVEDRCLAADGPVTPTLAEMTEEELGTIYRLATPTADAEPEAPTPEKLRAMAEWFDDPKNPMVVEVEIRSSVTAGFMLRRIAAALQFHPDATPEADES
jgi:hypothetical protein